jgi:hypothetical protein
VTGSVAVQKMYTFQFFPWLKPVVTTDYFIGTQCIEYSENFHFYYIILRLTNIYNYEIAFIIPQDENGLVET